MRTLRRKFDSVHFFCFCLIAVLSVYFLAGAHRPGSEQNESSWRKWYQQRRSANGNSALDPAEPVSYDKFMPLIWIGGVPRSGTTLIRAMLDAHSSVRCGEETRVVPRMLAIHSRMLSSEGEKKRLEEAKVTEPLLEKALAAYLLTVIAYHGEPAHRLCNKDPFTLRSIAKLAAMFPRSKFILMIRDGRAVAHSIVSRKVTIKGFDLTSYEAVLRDWNRAATGMWNECARHRDSCLPVYYERLILNTQSQLERIAKFLDLPWDEAMMHHERAVGKPGGISLSKKELSTDQVNKPVNQGALLKWVPGFPGNLRGRLDYVAPLLSRLGYNTQVFPPSYLKHLNPVAESESFTKEFNVPPKPPAQRQEPGHVDTAE